MGTIIFEAEDKLIEAARERAESEHKTLDEAIRQWMAEYGHPRRRPSAEEVMALVNELRRHVDSGGRKYTRDEMNER